MVISEVTLVTATPLVLGIHGVLTGRDRPSSRLWWALATAILGIALIGANDVVNPAAREDESSPIYGMPIIDVDRARTVFVLKRSMNTGFAGIQNPLFFKDNTRMLFGDAKSTVQKLVSEFKG